MDGVVFSPGPGDPGLLDRQVALARSVIEDGRPLLGICLGHQTLVEVCGGRIRRADRVMHGKTSEIHHEGRSVFAGLPSPLPGMRYHSLIAREDELPARLSGGPQYAESGGISIIAPQPPSRKPSPQASRNK